MVCRVFVFYWNMLLLYQILNKMFHSQYNDHFWQCNCDWPWKYYNLFSAVHEVQNKLSVRLSHVYVYITPFSSKYCQLEALNGNDVNSNEADRQEEEVVLYLFVVTGESSERIKQVKAAPRSLMWKISVSCTNSLECRSSRVTKRPRSGLVNQPSLNLFSKNMVWM